jgi:hypothetical protein
VLAYIICVYCLRREVVFAVLVNAMRSYLFSLENVLIILISLTLL